MACFKFIIHLTGWVSQAIFATCNLTLFLCSVTGNSLVIYLVWVKHSLRSPTFFLISFLAMSDLLTSLLGQTSYCTSLVLLNDVSCAMDKAIAFIHVTSCSSSISLLSLIARDRYLHVSKRQDYHGHTSNRFAITASIACYVFGMTVAILFTFEDRTVKISSTFAFAAIGTSSFVFICIKSRQITRIVKDHVKRMQANRQHASASEQIALMRSCNIEKSANKSIFSVIILFFVSWTPVIILMIIFTVHNVLNEPIADGYRVAFGWASTFSYLNGALNPIIYAYRCDAIGREIRKKIAKVTGRNRIVPSTTHTDMPRRTAETENSYLQYQTSIHEVAKRN